MRLNQHGLSSLSRYDKELCYHLCENHKSTFTRWWDPSKFNWLDSWALARYCYEYFDIWWDPDKFVYNRRSLASLSKNLKDRVDKWFNAHKIATIFYPLIYPFERPVFYLTMEVLPHDKKVELVAQLLKTAPNVIKLRKIPKNVLDEAKLVAILRH